MRVILVGGSTGGATVPLLAIANELRRSHPQVELLLVGTRHGAERQLAQAADLPFVGITAGKLRRYVSLLNVVDIVRLLIGVAEAWRLLRQFRPDAIVSVGSYVSVPIVYVGRLFGIPSLIHQQDIKPGLANRLCAPVAAAITVAFPESEQHFSRRKTSWVGNPIRPEILHGQAQRAYERFGLHKTLPVLLAFGGGTGALRLNQLVAEAGLNLVKNFQIVHLTGGRQNQFRVTHPNYHTFDFLINEMADAYAVADLVICRAGLSSLAEIAALGKPAIVIPIPATHQEANAAYFARHQAAVVLNERTLNHQRLEQTILELHENKLRRGQLAANVRALAKLDAAQTIVRQVERLAQPPPYRHVVRQLASRVSDIRFSELLAKHSNFKIGGPADMFVVARTSAELVATVRAVHQARLPSFILGGGANSVFSDPGFRGVVIQARNAEFTADGTAVTVGAGMNTGLFASQCLNAGLVGMEFMVGIYGTVGGAVRGNAGSFGREMRDIVRSCQVITGRGTVETWTNEQLRFGYRDSRLKHTPAAVITVRCTLTTGAVAEARQQIAEFTAYKRAHQPLTWPSAGCMFKNIVLKQDHERLRTRFAAVIKHGRLPAWALIAEAGLAGRRIGQIEVNKQHANFFVNLGGGTAEHVVMLASLVKQQVRDQFGVQLEEEVQFIGF
ncbi:MAG: UDP-N-acetylmuramate dehydrogenase [Candidatus Kerfeldbacteria bacterium]|nr:UDP-N-acetylmuramate dehydrogenase [Candidatus Kerfeldbacteria bacterium]